jgi:hypothetical protein
MLTGGAALFVLQFPGRMELSEEALRIKILENFAMTSQRYSAYRY